MITPGTIPTVASTEGKDRMPSDTVSAIMTAAKSKLAARQSGVRWALTH